MEVSTLRMFILKNNSYKTMTRALIRAALVIALVTAAVFLLIRLVPGDPVVMVLGEHATDESSCI